MIFSYTIHTFTYIHYIRRPAALFLWFSFLNQIIKSLSTKTQNRDTFLHINIWNCIGFRKRCSRHPPAAVYNSKNISFLSNEFFFIILSLSLYLTLVAFYSYIQAIYCPSSFEHSHVSRYIDPDAVTRRNIKKKVSIYIFMMSYNTLTY